MRLQRMGSVGVRRWLVSSRQEGRCIQEEQRGGCTLHSAHWRKEDMWMHTGEKADAQWREAEMCGCTVHTGEKADA